MFLLDTNVVRELRTRRGDPGVKQWVAKQRVADLAIGVVTVIEIETGILRKERTDPNQARILTRWFEQNVLTGLRRPHPSPRSRRRPSRRFTYPTKRTSTTRSSRAPRLRVA